MKKVLILSVFISSCFLCACSTGNNNTVSEDTTSAPHELTTVQQDSIILSHDSATVQTVVDSKEEEQNAIQQEKADVQKLKQDKEKSGH